jgi:hypothetical protein
LILSFRHRFLFLKTKKSAGTSLEIALSAICGPEDIITVISEEDQAARRAFGFPGPQNHIIRDIRNAKGGVPRELKFFNHMSYGDVRIRLPQVNLDDFFIFAVERDPVDRMMSLYHFQGGDERWGALDNWLENPKSAKFLGFDLYHDDQGECKADKIYFYEALDSACEDLSVRFGAEVKMPEYRAKGNYRKSREIPPLSDKVKRWLRENFSREYAAYHYEPPV